MDRRNIFAGLASGMAVLFLGPNLMAAAREKPPETDAEALQLLQKHGIVPRDMTWAKIERISASIGGSTSGQARTWAFIVKGKFIYTDSAK